MPKSILIVEDSPTQLLLLRHVLESRGYDVQVATNGLEGLKAARENLPDLILTDVTMPEMDGFELCHTIKLEERLKDIPVVLLTSLSDSEDIIHGLKSKADYYLTKPYNEGHLLSKIASILQSQVPLDAPAPHDSSAVVIDGKEYRIQANPQRMLNLLLSTYENAIQKNSDLLEAQDSLEKANQELEDTIYNLKKAKIAAEAANRSKDQFLAGMSHELRTPLNSIIGFSEILKEQTVGSLNPKQDRYVSHIMVSSRHLLALINDVLDISRLATGDMPLRETRLDIHALLDYSFHSFQENVTDQNITLHLDLTHLPMHSNVRGDAGKLKKIMHHLLSNAAKFTPDGGLVTVSAKLVKHLELSEIEISVADTGIGIRPEDRDLIFQEFLQLDADYDRKFTGTGLGLALTRKLVEMHNGRIEVKSDGEGKGTTFTFKIPAED